MKIKSSLVTGGLLVACLLTSSLFAADFTTSQAYVGVGGGLSSANNDFGTNYQVFAGYNVNRSWSAELGYTDAQTADTSWFATADYMAKIYSLAAQYNVHINQRLVWGAQLGGAYLSEQVAATILGQTVTSDPVTGWLPLMGTNLNLYWSKHISTGVSVSYIPSSDNLEGGVDGDVNLVVHF